jgi:hypothetical protein
MPIRTVSVTCALFAALLLLPSRPVRADVLTLKVFITTQQAPLVDKAQQQRLDSVADLKRAAGVSEKHPQGTTYLRGKAKKGIPDISLEIVDRAEDADIVAEVEDRDSADSAEKVTNATVTGLRTHADGADYVVPVRVTIGDFQTVVTGTSTTSGQFNLNSSPWRHAANSAWNQFIDLIVKNHEKIAEMTRK